MSGPVVARGFLGWSNMRGGTEFYSVENEPNGRWVKRRVPGTDAWGDLLADELYEKGAPEGCDLIVVAIPRFSDGPTVDELADRIRTMVESA